MERKTNDEPEILSAFSADKSEDYAILPRMYIKPNFEDKREKRVEFYKEKERAIFGYDYSDAEEQPKFTKETKNPKERKEEIKDIQLKFSFSEDDSDEDELTSNNRELEVNEDFGRQTIDLNGPIYDTKPCLSRNNECLSEIGKAESEADDVNKILRSMDCRSFKGFNQSDLGNSLDDNLNYDI